MKSFLKVLACVLLMIPARANGQTEVSGPISLDSCISLATSNNKSLASAQMQVEQYQHTEKAYWANYFPNFTAAVMDIWGNTEGAIEMDVATPISQALMGSLTQMMPILTQMGLTQQDLAAMQQKLQNINPEIGYKIGNVFAATVSMEQPIYMGGKITAAYEMAKLGRKMAEQGAALSHDEIVVQTAEAYSLLAKATALEAVALQYDSLLAKLLTDVENAKNRGMAGNSDLLKVQVKKNEAELQVRQAQNGMKLARMNLCFCLGLPLDCDIQVGEGLPSLEESHPADKAANVEGRPEYSYLEMKSQLARQQVKLERSNFLPQVGVAASFGYIRGLELMDNRLMGDDPAFVVMGSVKIPIYHANEAQHKVKAARLAYERTLIEQDELVRKMNLELQQASNNLDEGILEAELADRSLAQAEESLRESRRSYEVGLEPLSELLTAQTLWQQAYANQVIAHSQLMVLNMRYRKACGKL